MLCVDNSTIAISKVIAMPNVKYQFSFQIIFPIIIDSNFAGNIAEFTLSKCFYNLNVYMVSGWHMIVCTKLYPSTLVYSPIFPKIQFFYCLLSLLAPWGGPMVDTIEKFLKFRSADH